ncbi:putative Highly reducing polyketide synthase sdnO [Paratrimastix pyriformis]|uniref:Highly reducing polyketide synthase sdnO n=1 Tax=Paratrimastix pyriformis TaxID=342808 RepID=A0ABQ8UFG9_9EUKA|nr:putative Highly reducing polyketide synthase sdnO [Paratrimastix pyriformis]
MEKEPRKTGRKSDLVSSELMLREGTTVLSPGEKTLPFVCEGLGMDQQREDIAVVGLGCRFPAGANSPQEYWRLLRMGYDAITDIPADRWDATFWHDAKGKKYPGKIISKKGGFLNQKLEMFDYKFFGMSPREAAHVDPQQRLLMEVGWEALEDAGLVQEKITALKTGCFIGASSTDYDQLQFNDHISIDTHTQIGTATSIVSNRLSFMFNFQGPSLTIDTACSSSLVAMHFACDSLWNKECEMAAVGGVNVILRPEISVGFSKLGVLSPDGHCKPFDSHANGYVRCEGAAIALVRPLSAALANNDHVYAVIKSTFCNSCGHRSQGITFPAHDAQEELLYEALRRAHILPNVMQYAEAHGTGTDAGDPAEALALGTVFRAGRNPARPLVIGSVKGNIGHMEPGAGIASFIKLCMAMEHREMAAQIHYDQLNPKIDQAALCIRIADHHMPWPNVSSRTDPLFAVVNSFGFGGTNATAILSRDARCGLPLHERVGAACSPQGNSHLVVVSARSPAALKANVAALARAIVAPGAVPSLPDLSYTATARRQHHAYRVALVSPTVSSASALLEALARQISPQAGLAPGDEIGGAASGVINPEQPPRVALVFSGQGPQWWAMGRTLYQGPQSHPIFRETIDKVDAMFTGLAGWSLKQAMFGPESEAASEIHHTRVAQPALFALQVALYEVLTRAWGIRPVAVMGHSVGEISAAYACGRLSLADAVTVMYHRSRLQDQAADPKRPKGRMLAVGLPPGEVEALIEARPQATLALAAINSPSTCTISGDEAALTEIQQQLEQRQVMARWIKIEAAFHSPHMDFLRDELIASLADLSPLPAVGGVTMVSSVDPGLTEVPCDAEYWWRNVRQCVQFAGAFEQLVHRHQCNTFVEISAHPVLSANMGEVLRAMHLTAPSHVIVPTLVRPPTAAAGPFSASAWQKAPNALSQCAPQHLNDDHTALLRTLGQLHCRGCLVDWANYWTDIQAPHKLVPLPTYAWDRERCWNEPQESIERRCSGRAHPFLRVRLDTAAPTFLAEQTTAQMPWVLDHRLQSNIVVPGVTYVEIFLGAGAQVYGEGHPFQLTNVQFLKAFYMEEDEVHTVQVQMTPLHDPHKGGANAEADPHKCSYAGRIFSRVEPNGAWKLHAVCTMSPDTEETPAPVELDKLRAAASCPIDVKKFYKELHEDGLELAAAFQRVRKLWVDPDASFSLSRIEPIESIPAEDLSAYQYLHPTCLDSSIQAGLILRTRRGTFFPTKIARVRFYKKLPAGRCWAVSHLATLGAIRQASGDQSQQQQRPTGSGGLAGSSTTLVQHDGTVVGCLEGIQLQFLDKKKGKGLTVASRQEALGIAHEAARTRADPDATECFQQHWEFAEDVPEQALVAMPPAQEPLPVLMDLSKDLAAGTTPMMPTVRDLQARLCALLVLDALRSAPIGWTPAAGTRMPFDALCAQVGVTAEHRKYFHRILGFLHADGHLRLHNDDGVNLAAVEVEATEKYMAEKEDPRVLCQQLQRDYPEFRPSTALSATIAAQLAGILREQVDPIHLLFGEGGSVAEALYRDDAELRPYNEAAAALLERVVRHWPRGRPLRILEVGAGTGGLTAFLLPVLSAYECSYMFTDVGRMFLGQAKEKFARYGTMLQYAALDIEQDPLAQGFQPGHYDLIFAANVLHATIDLTQSVANCRKLLAPGGCIMCLEVIAPARRWVDLVFGTTKGWWRFADAALRPSHALLNTAQWAQLMRAVGFTQTGAVLGANGGQGLFLGQLPIAEAPAAPLALPAPVPAPADPTNAPAGTPGTFLLLAPRSHMAHVPALLLQRLLVAGHHVVVVLAPGAPLSATGPAALREVFPAALVAALPAGWEARVRVYPLTEADRKTLEPKLCGVFDEVRDQMPAPWWGVAHCWGLESALLRDSDQVAALRAGLGTGLYSLLNVVHAIGHIAMSRPPRLWTITAGAQQVSPNDATAWYNDHHPAHPAGQSACPVCSGNYGVNAVQRAQWGMVRVLNNERPQWHASGIDLSLCPSPLEVLSAADLMLTDNSADEMAVRGMRRLVPRLERSQVSALNVDSETLLPAQEKPADLSVPATPFALALAGPQRPFFEERPLPGTAESPVGPGQVAVRVHAAGVAFRDVLLSAGALPLGAAHPDTSYFGPHLGMEFAGVVLAVGTGVSHVQPGDVVMGLARESIASHVVTEATFVTKVPVQPRTGRAMGYDQAAALPMQYVTAWVALMTSAHLQAGERVLIHAAAGGVGMCAVHIAQMVGARVIATAGSPYKRDYLHQLGVEHVLDSRSPAFGQEVLALTNGLGVQVVLNSLAGEAMIEAGFSCLAPGGRFVEIGKADIYGSSATAAKLSLTHFARSLSYHAVSIDRLMYVAPALIGAALQACTEALAAGRLTPLPIRVYPVTAAPDAFRFVMHARHIGKVILAMPQCPLAQPAGASALVPPTIAPPSVVPLRGQGLGPLPYPRVPSMQRGPAFQAGAAPAAAAAPATPAAAPAAATPVTAAATAQPAPAAPAAAASEHPVVRHDATYVITGGTSGFGFAVGQHLVRWGARHLVLLSRSGGARETEQTAIAELTATIEKLAAAEPHGPAHVWVRRCDVGDEVAVEATLREVRAALPPIRGVVHCAMSLKDMLLDQLSVGDFEEVLHPKALGGWNMHRLTTAAHDPLDFFVLFSSMNAILGNQGQCNYACANTFLDALALHRRALGLPALAINWGVLAETGYVARHENVSKMLSSHGVDPFTPGWACDVLGQLLGGARQSQSRLLATGAAAGAHRDVDDEDTFEEGSEESAGRTRKVPLANALQRLAMTPANLGVFEMDFTKFFGFCPSMRHMERFAVFAAQADAQQASEKATAGEAGEAGGASSAALESLSLRERLENAGNLPAAAADLEKALAGQAAHVLGLGASLDVTTPLTSLGFDSMMAIELKNWVDRQLRLDVPVIDFVRGPSCRKLSLQLIDRMGLTAVLKASATTAGSPPPPTSSPEPSASPAGSPATAPAPVPVTLSTAPVGIIFAGQGGAGVGMGMDLYASSPAARAVWDEAEQHFMARFGLSLLQIVRENPKQLTVSFEGPQGAEWRKNYMSLSMSETPDAASDADRVFPTITAESPSYTFTSPNGLLNATHFTQPCITVFEKAAYEHLIRECGLDAETLRERTVVCGHSLGEYCALLCGAQLASVAATAELTFIRGLSMQHAVPRNEAGISPYAMMAVSPKRAGRLFDVPDPDGLLAQICAAVRAACGGRLLEIVNLNVRGDQLVVAGERYALWVLADVLDQLRVKSEDKAAAPGSAVSALEAICAASVASRPFEETPLTVPRMAATVQLPSIDVPFHSSLLRGTVDKFRRFLIRYLPPANEKQAAASDGRPVFDFHAHLNGRYIPNVTGKLFEVNLACAVALRDATQSPILEQLVVHGGRSFEQRVAEEGLSGVARLMLQEALAYQLAMPVQWVTAQDTLLHTLAIRRVIEIGPSTTLQGMMKKTLVVRPLKGGQQAQVLSWATEKDAILEMGPALVQ